MPPEQHQKSEADSVADIVRKNLSDIATLSGDRGLKVAVLVHPPGSKREIESLERFMELPIRKRAMIILNDHPSFIDYVERHKEAGTIILAEIGPNGGVFVAIIDYHLPEDAEGTGQAGGAAAVKSRWGDHVCKYVAEFTPEWVRWMKMNGQLLSQADMALFIEDNLFDIVTPPAAEMLDLVKTLEATQGAQFKSAIRLDNGDRDLQYTHQTQAKAGQQGNSQVPQSFKLKFAILTNGPAYDIECRFRYRISEGHLALGYEIVRPHKLVELALTDALVAIKQSLKLPVLLGKGSVTKP
ncbi:MAG TPA: DUF2303 family protein [Opitutaceae bacterium]|nr:DUF2303 family protein [Opitutaceae bacterium]